VSSAISSVGFHKTLSKAGFSGEWAAVGKAGVEAIDVIGGDFVRIAKKGVKPFLVPMSNVSYIEPVEDPGMPRPFVVPAVRVTVDKDPNFEPVTLDDGRTGYVAKEGYDDPMADHPDAAELADKAAAEVQEQPTTKRGRAKKTEA
jgi:hypothetical protein